MIRLISLILFSAALVQAKPVSIIFDTDMGNDVDDVMALAMIHQLERRGACKLLACTSTKDHIKSAPFIDVINTYYGRPDIPVGAVRKGVTPQIGKYIALADKKSSTGELVYPRQLDTGLDAPDAVDLIRKTLAAQPDGSVKLIQVGFSTNLAQLLDSKADTHSKLSGPDLVKKKVSQLLVMAGAFTPNGKYKNHREYNVIMDIPAAQKIAKEWPTEILWSGFEVGAALRYPWKSISEDFTKPTPNLMHESYIAYVGKPGTENALWDLTCVLHAAYPDRNYFGLSQKGQVHVTDQGLTHFTAKSDGRDRYFTMTASQQIRVLETLVQLVSTPPPAR
ncbi:nucleoside hydrolase [Oceaniferula spumae]|uniref:Nucleoside hydrolase n=1 Tax=Oceaniferula spumae TaxID=2979115 RepID=A0AAT9FLM4_9BACT